MIQYPHTDVAEDDKIYRRWSSTHIRWFSIHILILQNMIQYPHTDVVEDGQYTQNMINYPHTNVAKDDPLHTEDDSVST